MAICNRFTILRDGRLAATRAREGLTIAEIIALMVGRAASELYRRPRTRHRGGAPRLIIRGLRGVARKRASHATQLGGIDLEARGGEILGIAGLVGAGRTELARAVFGADPCRAERIEIDGEAVTIRSPYDAIRLGIGLVPEDRKQQALFLRQAIRVNFSIASLKRFARAGIFMDETAECAALERYRGSMKVRMTGPEQPIGTLSGGNQQKIVLARWLALDPKILIVDEPTRGIDVAAKAEVHELLDALAARGIAVVAISSELPEVLAIADRIVTMREGQITGEVAPEEATQAGLMALMTLERPAGVAEARLS